jgi:hypothetical protein
MFTHQNAKGSICILICNYSKHATFLWFQFQVLELRSLSKLVNKARFASFCKGESMLELWLEEEKLGVSTSCSEQLKFFEIDSIDEVVLTSARQGSTQSTLNKEDDLLEATRLLPTHVKLSASVVSAPKGAKLFCVVLDQHRALANLLPKCLATALPLTVLPTIGQGCVVNAPKHLGGGWTRGLVVSCNRLTVTVALIDLDMAEVIFCFLNLTLFKTKNRYGLGT